MKEIYSFFATLKTLSAFAYFAIDLAPLLISLISSASISEAYAEARRLAATLQTAYLSFAVDFAASIFPLMASLLLATIYLFLLFSGFYNYSSSSIFEKSIALGKFHLNTVARILIDTIKAVPIRTEIEPKTPRPQNHSLYRLP